VIDLHDDYEDWDDELLWDEDPKCYACNDTGNVITDYDRDPPGYRSCPECSPGWLQRFWWQLTDPIRGRWIGWRMRRRAPVDDDELPF
jgi:hypothetical protein